MEEILGINARLKKLENECIEIYNLQWINKINITFNFYS